MKTLWKWLILTALAAYAVFAATWAFTQAAAGRCRGIEIEVEGAGRPDTVIQKGIVDQLLRYDRNLIGKPLASLDIRQLERYLGSLSNFEDVQCAITSQQKLRISVLPMIPEIRVFDRDKSYYINKDGKHIAANAEFFTDVPVVTGRFSRQLPPQYVLPVTRFIAADSLLRHLVAMVEVADADNILLVPRIGRAVINIGRPENLPYKRRSIAAAYRDILPYKGWNTYDTISVKFKGQIVATRADKTQRAHALPFEETEDLEEATLQGQLAADSIPATHSTHTQTHSTEHT